jgi:microcin C transport system substrate-binding protein
VLRNAQGQPFVIEYLDSNEAGARVVTPWARNLEKLGIRLNYRPVDFALYQQRLQRFEFDMTSIAYGGTHSPGQEYADLFGSKAAATRRLGQPGRRGQPGGGRFDRPHGERQNPGANCCPPAARLERVITHSHYLVPQWSAPTHRMAFNQKRLARPEAMPPYATGEGWAIMTWWAR